MPEFGQKLREARKKQGLAVEVVVEKLGIHSRYIKALEEEDFSKFPDRKYAAEIVATYAKLLKLDSPDLVREFNDAWTDSSMAKAYIKETFSGYETKETNSASTYYKIAAGAGILVVVLLLALGLNNWMRPAAPPDGGQAFQQHQNSGEEQPPADDKTPEAPAPGEKAAQPGEPAEKDAQGKEVPGKAVEATGKVRVEISTPRGDCWLEVTVDGENVFYRTVRQGEEPKVFEGEKEIAVVFGNAAAVDVVFNGDVLHSLGGINEVVKEVFISATETSS